MRNSLIQTVLKLTAPGVPDIYNGAELWDLSMVDPDNRRPVDYPLRQRQLGEIEAALQPDRARQLAHWLRQLDRRPHQARHHHDTAAPPSAAARRSIRGRLPAAGAASGARAEEIGAYARVQGSRRLLVAFARHSRRREREPFDPDTHCRCRDDLARNAWTDILSGVSIGLEPMG